jgi:hypothetical protein
MNTADIYNFICYDETLTVIFNGFFSADNYKCEKDGIYIVNTDHSS